MGWDAAESMKGKPTPGEAKAHLKISFYHHSHQAQGAQELHLPQGWSIPAGTSCCEDLPSYSPRKIFWPQRFTHMDHWLPFTTSTVKSQSNTATPSDILGHRNPCAGSEQLHPAECLISGKSRELTAREKQRMSSEVPPLILSLLPVSCTSRYCHQT